MYYLSVLFAVLNERLRVLCGKSFRFFRERPPRFKVAQLVRRNCTKRYGVGHGIQIFDVVPLRRRYYDVRASYRYVLHRV
jgi:hypothetical protein